MGFTHMGTRRGRWSTTGGRRCVGSKNNQTTNQHNPQYVNDWAPLAHKRHILPHPAQPRHTNDRALRTRQRHRQEHRPQRPTERSDPTQHAEGRTGDCPGPRKGATTRRTVTRGVGGWGGGRPLQAYGAERDRQWAVAVKRSGGRGLQSIAAPAEGPSVSSGPEGGGVWKRGPKDGTVFVPIGMGPARRWGNKRAVTQICPMSVCHPFSGQCQMSCGALGGPSPLEVQAQRVRVAPTQGRG